MHLYLILKGEFIEHMFAVYLPPIYPESVSRLLLDNRVKHKGIWFAGRSLKLTQLCPAHTGS